MRISCRVWMLAFFIVSILASVVSAWVINPGGVSFAGANWVAIAIKLAIAALVLTVGRFDSCRGALRAGADGVRLVPAGAGGHTPGRRLMLDLSSAPVQRTADEALA